MNGTPAQPDPAAAYLAEVRERWGTADKATWHDYATALEHLAKALRSIADIPRLLAAVEAVLALTRDTDGNYLPPECEVPVGEVVAAITAELLKEDQ